MTKVVEYTYHNPNVNSSAISEIWYSSPSRELYVKFRDSGQLAGYADVSPVAADKLVDASSVGQFYAYHVKGVYKGLDTSNLTFRSAPGLDKKKTNVYPGPTPKATKPKSAAAPVTPTKKSFRVRGNILKPVPVTEMIMAETMEEAMELFRQKYAAKEPEVVGVEKF